MPFVSALDPQAEPALRNLEQRMLRYYKNPAYHTEWIRHANAGWNAEAHGAQLAAVSRIEPGSALLEIGCGDTAAAAELLRRIPDLRYFGVDVSIPATRDLRLRLARSSGTALPFPNETFDVAISMFTIEHTTRPDLFLDEAWRVLKSKGHLILIAPDFLTNAMASERIGLRYGTGRDKARRGQLLDAVLTMFDSRVRLPAQRRRRARQLAGGGYTFPVWTSPRCLSLPGFVTDCDAVYPSCPEEIANYFGSRHSWSQHEIFFRDRSTFGLQIIKP